MRQNTADSFERLFNDLRTTDDLDELYDIFNALADLRTETYLRIQTTEDQSGVEFSGMGPFDSTGWDEFDEEREEDDLDEDDFDVDYDPIAPEPSDDPEDDFMPSRDFGQVLWFGKENN